MILDENLILSSIVNDCASLYLRISNLRTFVLEHKNDVLEPTIKLSCVEMEQLGFFIIK